MIGSKVGRRPIAAACAAAALAALTLTPAAAKPPSGGGGGGGGTGGTVATSYSGDAEVVNAHVEVLPALGSPIQGDLSISKVGPLPSTGGFMHDSLLTVNAGVGSALGVFGSAASAATAGAGDRSHSSASVAEARVGLSALTLNIEVEATVLRSQADARCGTNGAEVDGRSTIAGLVVRVNGLKLNVQVGTTPNQVVAIEVLGARVATLILNEQQSGPGSITVNALHLSLPRQGLLGGVAAADVVISHAHADIVCQGGDNPPPPPPCQVKDFVTGGGQIPGASGQRVSFGMVGGEKPNGLSGHLNVVDHGTQGHHIQGTTLTKYEVVGVMSRRLTYSGTVDGAPATITVVVTDNGEPGTADTFTVSTSTGYSANGTPISRGNIQLHHPGGCDTTTTPPKGGKPKP
jgi:hypothetical protein